MRPRVLHSLRYATLGALLALLFGGVQLAAQESGGGFVTVPDSGTNLGGFGNAQPEAAPPADPGGISGAPLSGAPPYAEYTLASHDVLKLWVYQAPEFSIPVRIAPDGAIRLPFCRQSIQLEGLTAFQAESVIAQALVEEGLMVSPTVMVEITQYHARPVLVSGSVEHPTIFQAVGPTTLLDAISRAGGLSTSAGEEILIERPASPGHPRHIERVPTHEFLSGDQGVQMVTLVGGETVRVPSAPTAFVIGAGGTAGPIPLTSRDGMEFFEFMARAGVHPSSKHRKAIIFRPRPGAAGLEKDQIEVDLKKVVKFEVSSLTVLPEDVVYFVESDSQVRNLTTRILEAVVMQSIWQFSYLLWR